jgi:hypothetical protein
MDEVPMAAPCPPAKNHWPALTLTGAVTLLLALWLHGVWQLQAGTRLLLAPMIGALDNCLFSKNEVHSRVACRGEAPSAVGLIEPSLQALGPAVSTDGRFELGYTLNVPLLRMFTRSTDGDWLIDRVAVQRVAQTIQDVKRPVVLYLFSTHFGVGGPLEAELAQDAANLAHTPQGPLPKDKYYNVDIFPWGVARAGDACGVVCGVRVARFGARQGAGGDGVGRGAPAFSWL